MYEWGLDDQASTWYEGTFVVDVLIVYHTLPTGLFFGHSYIIDWWMSVEIVCVCGCVPLWLCVLACVWVNNASLQS